MQTHPRYHLSALTQRGATTYHMKHKKPFLMHLNGLRELKTLKSFSFSVEYYKGGFNQSITYNKNQIDEALRVAKILTAKSETNNLIKH